MTNIEEELNFEGAFGKPHPLLIPIIIKEVFSYLTFKRLKSCRLVCRVWEQEAYTCLRGHTRVKIDNYQRLKDYVQNFKKRTDFCDCFEIGGSLNIRALHMVAFFNTFGPSIQTLGLMKTKWTEDQLKRLLFKKLDNLTSLTLDCIVPLGGENVRYFQSQLPTQLLKLKHLNIDVQGRDIHSVARIQTFFRDLLSVAPNLEIVACPKSELKYRPSYSLFRTSWFMNGEPLDSLDEVRIPPDSSPILFDVLASNDQGSPTLPNLAQLDVSMTLREEDIRKLHIKSYPLQILDMIISMEVSVVTLHSFLDGLGQTLQSLTLRFLHGSPCALEFPSAPNLKNLKSLKITWYKRSMEFIQYFTKLESLVLVKVLRLSLAFPTNEMDLFAPLQKMRTLEVLEVKILESTTIRRQLIPRWASIFPNLKKLNLDNLSNGILHSIYSEMTGLEELIARNGNFSDFGVTGIPVEECKSIVERKDFSTSVLVDIPPLMSISCMKNLRRLELGSKKLTDVGIIFGVAKCQRLKNLWIMTYGMTNVSLRKVVESLNLDSLKTELCIQLTVDELDYLSDKLNGCELSINEYQGPMKFSDMWKFVQRNHDLKVAVPVLAVEQIGL